MAPTSSLRPPPTWVKSVAGSVRTESMRAPWISLKPANIAAAWTRSSQAPMLKSTPKPSRLAVAGPKGMASWRAVSTRVAAKAAISPWVMMDLL